MSLTKLRKIVYFLTFLFFVTSCTNLVQPNPAGYTDVLPTESDTVIQESQVVFRSLNELFIESDLIITGEVVAEMETINTARDPDDHTKEHPTMYSIGQIYEVEITSIIQGKAPKTIYVVQYQGTFNKNETVSDKNFMESIQKSFGIIRMTIGRNYMMYLRSSPYSYSKYSSDVLYGSIGHPWLFDLTHPDCVSVEDSNPSIKDFFPPTSYDVISRSIQMAKDGIYPLTENGYPAPLEKSSFCLEENQNNSYPAP